MPRFEPDQLVLVRENDEQLWRLAHFSHTVSVDWNVTTDGKAWASQFIIPYAGNEHLLGTTESTTPKWEPKPGELVAVRDDSEESWRARRFVRRDEHLYACQSEKGLSCTNWHYCEPLRKHFTIPEE